MYFARDGEILTSISANFHLLHSHECLFPQQKKTKDLWRWHVKKKTSRLLT